LVKQSKKSKLAKAGVKDKKAAAKAGSRVAVAKISTRKKSANRKAPKGDRTAANRAFLPSGWDNKTWRQGEFHRPIRHPRHPQPIPKPGSAPKPALPSPQIAWPSFTGAATLVGSTPSGDITVYYDQSLGAQALENAQALVASGDTISQQNAAIFSSQPGTVNVIVFALGGRTDGTGGADHMGCDYNSGGNIEVDASFGNNERVLALFEAELSEDNMGGQLCGYSNGEALSRWCAAAVSNNALADFATAPDWANSGMPDYVSRVDPTDQNPISIGCGMAFLSWLLSQGHSLNSIAVEMVKEGNPGTLATLYAALTGKAASRAFRTFIVAVNALGGPSAIASDDPFGALKAGV
jgi:hypothetical protein